LADWPVQVARRKGATTRISSGGEGWDPFATRIKDNAACEVPAEAPIPTKT